MRLDNAPDSDNGRTGVALVDGTSPSKRTRMKKFVLVGPRGELVCDVCHIADRPHTRVRGVIGWRDLRRGEGVLIKPTFSIHTAFVRFPIDAVFLDGDLKVLRIAQDMKPWRLAGFWGATSVLELAAGECRRLGVMTGDRLAWGQI
jgi:uncharacterized protein